MVELNTPAERWLGIIVSRMQRMSADLGDEKMQIQRTVASIGCGLAWSTNTRSKSSDILLDWFLWTRAGSSKSGDQTSSSHGEYWSDIQSKITGECYCFAW